MKPDIFVHYASVSLTPVETAQLLIRTLKDFYNCEVGNWYGELILGYYDKNNPEYDVCHEVSDLQGKTDLINRIQKNGSAHWNTYSEVFSNEDIYINLFPADANLKSSSIIVNIAASTSDGYLADFLLRNENYKISEQLDFFENIASAISADYYGIWSDKAFLPLTQNCFYKKNGLAPFYASWKQGTLDEKNINGKLDYLNKKSMSNYQSAYILKN